MKILVTGCNGFVGRHAVALLQQRGHEVIGSDVQPASPLPVIYRQMNICDKDLVFQIMAELQPEAILHLGGIAFVPVARENPQIVFQVNTIGTLNILDTMRTIAASARLLVASSAEVYGTAHAAMPLTEDAPCQPNNIYGIAKAAADHAARLYADDHHLHLMVARPANHIGVGQSPNFVVSSFASQLAAIAGGAPAVMRVGNLDQQRDFTDVRDVVRAYALLLEQGQDGCTYNIASGATVTIREILQILCGIAGVSPRIEVDPALFRPLAYHPAYDTSRIRSHVGWMPEIPLSDTLRDIYNERLQHIRA